MGWIMTAGIVLALAGGLGIVWCIFAAMRIRRDGGTDDALRPRLQRLVIVNMVALMVAMLGLGLVVVGLILG